MGLHEAILATIARHGPNQTPSFEFGELYAYDPTNHTGQFKLPAYGADPSDPSGQTPVLTGFIQLGTFYTDANGGGAQFPPQIGAQAVIFFLDQAKRYPMCGVFYFNAQDTPPFPDGTTWGWMDRYGNFVTTTTDGATPGDGAHGVKLFANGGFTSIATLSGFSHTQDDLAQEAKQVTPGGLQTIHSDVTEEIAHVAPNVNLGTIGADLSSANAVFNQTHISNYDSNLQTAKLDDYIKFANLLNTAGVVNAGQLSTILAALVSGWTHGTTIPGGSSVVKAVT